MSNPIQSIEPDALATVTGGTHSSSSSDQLLKDIGNLATSIKDITQKTSGFSSTQMLLLCCLALQRNQSHANVVYVGPRSWW
ncbi:MAG TPA: hypothetical protein VFQ53_08035 [Kofleriaceae bacterium]|nr:hypothetical protein [Kofleriaceae bacterium]